MALGSAQAREGGAVSLNPVRLTLPAAKPVGLIEVANPGRPSAMQLRAFRWRQADGEDMLEATDDLILNPPMFALETGARQLVRVGLRPPASAGQELTYRLLIDQIPEGPRRDDGGTLSLPIRLSVPVFVVGPGLAPARLTWRIEHVRGGAHVVMVNCGGRHARIDAMALTRGAAAQRGAGPIYLLAGTARSLPLEAALVPEADSALRLSASTEDGLVEAELDARSADPHWVGAVGPCG